MPSFTKDLTSEQHKECIVPCNIEELLDAAIGAKQPTILGETMDDKETSLMVRPSSSTVSHEGNIHPVLSDRQRDIMLILLHWLCEMGMTDSAKQVAQELMTKRASGLKYDWTGNTREKLFTEWVNDD
jgi:hypothetical protein